MTYVETAPAPAAGWYGDPGSEHHLRWWSGTAWTDNVAPKSWAEIAPEPTPWQESTPLREPAVSFEPAVSPESAPPLEPVAWLEPAASPQPAISFEPTLSPEPAISLDPTLSPEPAISFDPTPSPEPAISLDPTPSPEPATSVDAQPISRRAAIANERASGIGLSPAVAPPADLQDVIAPAVTSGEAGSPAISLPAISLPDNVPQQGWILGSDAGYLSPYAGSGHSRNWSQVKATPSRWNTRYAWLIAFLPWIQVLTGVLAVLLVRNGIASTEVTMLLSVLPMLAFIDSAIRDRRQLVDWGYERPASAWWLLLGPLVYLIARTVRLRAEARRGVAPLWAFVINSIAPVVAAMAAVALFNDRILALMMY